jgi:hypothetical protein
MVLLVAAFLVLGWWQIGRARGGNALSFGYAVEWPAFAIFVVFVWYREIRNERRGPTEPVRIVEPVLARRDREKTAVARGGVAPGGVAPAAGGVAGADAGDDAELEEYNRLLAWLAANPGSRRSDFPR